MGPRLKDVEDIATNFLHMDTVKLQWGHVSRTWKTRGFGSDNSVPAGLASMGPRLKDVEDEPRYTDGSPIYSLQWGHVSRTWKTRMRCRKCAAVVRLQWGHVSRTWKTHYPRDEHAHPSYASMGPRLKDVEDEPIAPYVYQPKRRFNGATSQGRGRPR